MIEKTYRITDKILRISLDNDAAIPDSFEGFLCSSHQKPDISFLSEGLGEEHTCYGICYLSDKGEKINNVFFSQKDRRQMLYSYEDDYSEYRMQLDGQCSKEVFAELLMAGFYSYASLRSTLLMHASAVCIKGKTIIFTAASGVGKTTQAELWKSCRGATIINGDKVLLTKDSDKIIAWGSPWNGSSAYAENIGAEAAAIIVLEQGEENQIRKLSGMEMLEHLIPHVFFPNWDVRCEQAVLDFLNEVLKRTDVYLLRCRPDEEAVALVEKTVF